MPTYACGCVVKNTVTKCPIASQLWAEYLAAYEQALTARPVSWNEQTAVWQDVGQKLAAYQAHFKLEGL